MPLQAIGAALHREHAGVSAKEIECLQTPGDQTGLGFRTRCQPSAYRTAHLDTIEPSRKLWLRHPQCPRLPSMRHHMSAAARRDRRCSDPGVSHALHEPQHSSKNSSARVSDAHHGPLAAVSPGCPPPTVEPKCHRAPSTMAKRSCRKGKRCLFRLVRHRTSIPPGSDRVELRCRVSVLLHRSLSSSSMPLRPVNRRTSHAWLYCSAGPRTFKPVWSKCGSSTRMRATALSIAASNARSFRTIPS